LLPISAPLYRRSARSAAAEAVRLARQAVELGRDDAVALCTGGYGLARLGLDFDAGAFFIDRARMIRGSRRCEASAFPQPGECLLFAELLGTQGDDIVRCVLRGRVLIKHRRCSPSLLPLVSTRPDEDDCRRKPLLLMRLLSETDAG
jgi:hypothetical protein